MGYGPNWLAKEFIRSPKLPIRFHMDAGVEVTGGVEIVARQFSSRSPPGLSWLIDCREAVPIPNAVRATIAAEKLTAYLLNPSHKRGGAKARLRLSLGYRTDAPW